MGQCLGGEREYERTEYKYIPYDWLGENSKEKEKLKEEKLIEDKLIKSQSETTKEIAKVSGGNANLTGTIISVDVSQVPGSDKKHFVFTTNSDNLKDLGSISFTFTMGQCTSVQKSDHSIEEEPYSVARRNEPEISYRSKYEPYIWDIYVDTDSTAVRKKDRSRSYDSLKWDVYAHPEKAKTKPVKGEKQKYGDLYEANVNKTDDDVTPDIPNGRARPGESLYDPNSERPIRKVIANGSVERSRPGNNVSDREDPVNYTKTPNTSVDYSTDSTKPCTPTEDRDKDNTPVKEVAARLSRNAEDDTPRKYIPVTNSSPYTPRRRRVESEDEDTPSSPYRQRRPITVNGKTDEPVRKPIAINGDAHETPRRPYTGNSVEEEIPRKAVPMNGDIEETPRKRTPNENRVEEMPVKRIAKNGEMDKVPIKQNDRNANRSESDNDDDVSDDDDDDVNDYDDIMLEERTKKDAPPRYKDVVPFITTSVIQYDTVPTRVVKQPSEDSESSDKQKRVNKPEKPEESDYLYKPKPSEEPRDLYKPTVSDKSNKSPEKKPIEQSESPKRVDKKPVQEKTDSTQHVVKADIPKTVSRLLTNESPDDKKEEMPEDELSPTALMKNPIHVKNVGTRPEKNDIKVLLPSKFPQLFSGKRNAWRGLLLFGPAGSGKASLATAVAKEIGHSYTTLRTFITLNNFNGNAVAAMFKKARDDTPHVIIIDHLDGLSAAEIRELHKQITSSTEDEFEGLLVVGISDSPWLLDKAVVELFEKRIFITLPSAASRAELFRDNFDQSQHSLSEEDFIELGAWSEGYTCADIISVVNETMMHSLRKIQDSTYFKKVSSKDPVTSRYVDLYTPCSPGEPGAIEMDWTRVPEKKLQEPHIRLCDVLVALRIQKPSLNPDDIEKHKQFAKRFTQHT